MIDTFDFNKIDIGEQNENGFLRIVLNVGKVGVLPYPPEEMNIETDKEVVYAFRDEEDLFDVSSMKSLEGVPVLIGHEWIDGNKQETQVGSLSGAPYRKGVFLKSEALITDPAAIAAIQARKLSEISPGFIRQIENIQGTWEGFPYDVKFKDIRYNHVALLPAGQARGGHDLTFVYDKKHKIEDFKMTEKNELQDFKTEFGNVKTDQAGVDVLKKVMDACAPFKKRGSDQMPNVPDLEATMKRIDDLNAQISTLAGERDALAANLEQVKAELEQRTQAEPEMVQELVEETLEAREVIDKMGGLDSLPENWRTIPVKELKKHVIDAHFKLMNQTVDEKKLTPEYIEGAWRMITADLKREKKVPLGKVVDSINKNQIKEERDPMSRLGYRKNKEEGK